MSASVGGGSCACGGCTDVDDDDGVAGWEGGFDFEGEGVFGG